MTRKVQARRALLAAASALALSLALSAPAQAVNCTANGGTPLQTALNNSVAGGTVTVDAGQTCAAGFDLPGHSITLQGGGAGATFDGNGVRSLR